MLGKKVELAGSDAEEFYDVIATLIHQASSTNPLQYAPIWKYLPKYRKQHLRYLETHKKLYAFIDKLIDEHIDTYKDGFLRDFIDFFLAESERRKEANNNDLGVFQSELFYFK